MSVRVMLREQLAGLQRGTLNFIHSMVTIDSGTSGKTKTLQVNVTVLPKGTLEAGSGDTATCTGNTIAKCKINFVNHYGN